MHLAWRTPPDRIEIAPGEVHVWRARLDGGPSCETLAATLDDHERQAAARFRFDLDRARFVARRAVLRNVLARYLGVAPEELRFRRGAYGKPAVESCSALEFNASHSAGLAAVAVGRSGPLGIDVERVRDDLDDLSIAERFFAPAEVDVLRTVEASRRRGVFFALWTAKEACLKALGRGLSLSLDRVVVRPDATSQIVEMNDAATGTDRWLVERFEAWPGYAAALAMPAGAESARWQAYDYAF